MKKVFALPLLVIGFIFGLTLLLTPQQVSGSMKRSQGAPATAMPDSVMKIVKRACMDCHADDGNGMARMHINFSKWDTYKPEQQADKAKDMCKELTKGGMPTKGWKKKNADLVPTQAEIDVICRWSAALNK